MNGYVPPQNLVWYDTHNTLNDPPLPFVEDEDSFVFTISWDTKKYGEELKNGYSKGDSERLNCFKLGYFYIIWGKD